jgi:hypothetical protein
VKEVIAGARAGALGGAAFFGAAFFGAACFGAACFGAAFFRGEGFLAAAFLAFRGAFREALRFIPDLRPDALRRAGFRVIFFLRGFAAFLFARFFAKLTPFHRKA